MGCNPACGAVGVARRVGRGDALLDDPAFFARFVPYFDPRIGRPSVPMETYLRMMFSEVPLPAGLRVPVP